MARSGSIQVQDIRMYYEIHGTGTPVLLIMGLVSDISEWTWLIHALAAHHEVLAFDNRGAGRTDKPDSPYTIRGGHIFFLFRQQPFLQVVTEFLDAR